MSIFPGGIIINQFIMVSMHRFFGRRWLMIIIHVMWHLSKHVYGCRRFCPESYANHDRVHLRVNTELLYTPQNFHVCSQAPLLASSDIVCVARLSRNAIPCILSPVQDCSAT